MRNGDIRARESGAPPIARRELLALLLIIALAGFARLVAILVLHEPIVSDAANYLEMARTAVAPGPMRDTYGNVAFYSPGYPFILAGAYALGMSGLAAAQAINLLLGLISTFLIYLVARRTSGQPLAALIAAGGYAVLIPAVAGVALVQRENLSVPLLLLFALCVVELPATRRPGIVAAVSGVVYGCGLLAGASIMFTIAAGIAALAWRRSNLGDSLAAGFAFCAGTVLMLTPWLFHVDHQLGRPVLTTNGPFNLYVGNNPAADGRFVSLRDTPIGAEWHALRARAGELGATDHLGQLAIAHIRSYPAQTVALSMKKLALFWLPDLPDATDADHGSIVTALRWGETLQYLLLAGFGLVAVLRWGTRTRGERLVILTLAAFWAIHAAAYVMPRYRQPALPLLVILAAGIVTPLVGRMRFGAPIRAHA